MNLPQSVRYKGVMMINKAKLVASLVFVTCALVLPALSVYQNLPRTQGIVQVTAHKMATKPVSVLKPGTSEATPAPIVLDEVKVTGSAPKPTVAPKPHKQECKLQRLEQGGSPSSPFVLACVDAH